MGTVIELCGLPGSGKSHLERRVCAALQARGITVRRPRGRIGPDVPGPRRLTGKLGLVTRAVLDEPRSSVRLATALRPGTGRGPADALARWVAWTSTQSLAREAQRAEGVAVLDEGVLQAIWSIGLRSDVHPVLRLLEQDRARWTSPGLVLVVAAPIDVLEQRLARRRSQHSRTQRLAPSERARELRRGRELLDLLVDWWESTSGPAAQLLRVGDDHSTERVVGLIGEHLDLEDLDRVPRQQRV